MNDQELRDLLIEGTSITVEICEAPSDSEILNHICALTNTEGGYLVIGARYLRVPNSDGLKFEPVGLQAPSDFSNRLESLAEKLKPSVPVGIELVPVGTGAKGKIVGAVTVPPRKGPEKTTTPSGQIYLRLNDESVPAGVGHIPTNRLGRQVREKLAKLNKEGKLRIETAIKKKLPETHGHELEAILLNREWAEEVSDLMEPIDEVTADTIDRLKRLFERYSPDEFALFGDCDIPAIILTISAMQNTQEGYVFVGVRRKSDTYDFTGLTIAEIERLERIKSLFPIEVLSTEILDIPNDRKIWRARVRKSGIILPAPDNSETFLRREGGRNIRENLPPKQSADAAEDEAIEVASATDSSPAAASLRVRILEEFAKLKEKQQMEFARTQLGSAPMQSDWQLRFRESLEYCEAQQLQQIARHLADYKQNGQLYGNKYEYRRDANPEEECLNLDIYTRVLAKFFSSTKDDVCFGLFGHWGRGKTHLMNCVGDELKEYHNYEVVRFSAWKYRTNPELWIHLYQSFVKSMRSGNWFVRLFVPFRAGLANQGIWPIVFALFFQAIALVPFSEKYLFVQNCFQLVGAAGILYAVVFYLRVKRLGLSLSTYLQVADYSSHLGLQATVGDDLKSLLIGWMPKYALLPSPLYQSSGFYRTIQNWGRHAAGIPWLGLACYLGLATWIFFLLSPHVHSALISQLDESVLSSVVTIVRCLWLVAALAFPSIALLSAKGPNRILLVVDDLDRCSSEHILEIIESVMLLLDDAEIQRRLQIAVLFEEEAVHFAVAEKYRYLWDSSDKSYPDEVRSTVIEENIEKLFLAHLRLGPLNASEIIEVANRYARDGKEPPQQLDVVPEARKQLSSEVQSELPNVLEPIIPPPQVQASMPTEVQPGKNYSQEPLKLTDYEIDILISQIQSRYIHSKRWGPRSIRCLINKYLLARELLLEIDPRNLPDPRALAEVLLESSESTQAKAKKPPPFIEQTKYKGVDYVARQVR